jgi:hypothetical protein
MIPEIHFTKGMQQQIHVSLKDIGKFQNSREEERKLVD